MRRLTPGSNVNVLAAGRSDKLRCRLVAVAGSWALLSVTDASAALPEWLDGEVYLSFFVGAHPVQLRGRAEPGRLPGELRFAASAGVGEPEPRSAPRVAVSLTGSMATPFGDTVAMEVVDLSAGGLRLRHQGRFTPGESLRVQFMLPTGRLIDADVEVRGGQVGVSAVRFVHFHSGSTQEVAEWCVGELRTARGNGADRGVL